MRTRWALAVVGALVLFSMARALIATRTDAFTIDEPWHIIAGASHLRDSDYRLNPEQPPLVKIIAASAVPGLQVIDTLPESYRAALVLHEIEGLTAEQTAEISGCSLATAKIRIHRARARLTKALELDCKFYRDSEDVFRCDRKN